MPVVTLRLKNPLQTLDGTGVDVSPNTPIFGLRPEITVVNIGQDVSSTSSVSFDEVTSTTGSFIIDNSNLLLKENNITGSFTQSGDFIVGNNLVINGTLTGQEFKTSNIGSFTIFTSGSTKFGDSTTDLQSFTGSLKNSGSTTINKYNLDGISNDSTFSGSSSTKLVTENSVITKYTEKNVYLRKIAPSLGTIVSANSASFNAVTASAPSGLTPTSENDFMFFCNGMIMEHDALDIQQSGSKLLLKVNSDNIGYNLQSTALGDPTTDEIVGWGKFN